MVAAMDQAASIASFAWIAVPVLAPLVVALVAFVLGHEIAASFAAGAVAMFLVLLLVALFPLRAMLRRLFYGFRLESVQITLDLDAGGKRQHVRHLAIRPRIVRTGIRTLPDHYCAPGPGFEEEGRNPGAPASRPSHTPRVTRGNVRILGPIYDEPNEFWIYQMDLGASLSSGTKRDIELVQNLDFSSAGYAPRLQRTILDPTDHLLLAAKIPADQWPVEAEGEEIAPGNRPKKIPVEIDERSREVRLVVDKPRFGRVYRIRWSASTE